MELKAHDQSQNSGVESLLARFITELLVHVNFSLKQIATIFQKHILKLGAYD